jgi:protein kinase C substrate 80K-H
MIFEHGQACWNGPERSLKVFMECGESNEIYSVSEPSKCEYIMKMKTPATCPEPMMKDEL